MSLDLHQVQITQGFENNLLPDVSRPWEILWRCLPSIRALGFDHENINSLWNSLTLTGWLHEHFGAFQIAFESTVSTLPLEELVCFIALLTRILKDVEKNYKVHVIKGASERYKTFFPPEVRFRNHDQDKDRDLPSPILLDCHFRLAKILNASGMAAVFDFDFDEWEEVKARTGDQLHT